MSTVYVCVCELFMFNYVKYNNTSLYKNGKYMFAYIFTVEPMDYNGLSMILSFAACETRQCVNIAIVNDSVNEPVEEFDVTLERTIGLDSRISLQPVDARVIIHDDDEGKLAFHYYNKWVGNIRNRAKEE